MGVNLSGSTPRNPYGRSSILDRIIGGAGELGSAFSSGLEGVLNGIGSILTNAAQTVSTAFHGIVTGVINFIGGISRAIGSIFGGGKQDYPEPLPPVFNPIKTNLEEALQPKFDKVDQLLQDSAGVGEESKTIQQQMRELLDPDNPNSELWILQDEVNRLNDERNDLQDKMIELNRKNIEATEEYISRSIFIPRNQPVNDTYFDVVAHPTNGHRWRVKAKPGWTGHYVWQSTYYFAQGDASPVIDGHEVGFTRQWDKHAWNRTPSILTYWVRQDKYDTADKKASSYVTADSEWMDTPGFSHEVTETAEHDISFKVTWANADYGTSYGHRVLRNGTEILRWFSSKLGPTWPWESGVRTRTFSEFGIPLEEGDVLSFQTYSSGSTTARRTLSSAERKIGWLIKATEETEEEA